MRRSPVVAAASCLAVAAVLCACWGVQRQHRTSGWHHRIIATTFWVGEVFSSKSDGSQVFSTYDAQWQRHYGGCDGTVIRGGCRTEKRSSANGFFPLHMTPRQNPFYVDVPFDDVNDTGAFAQRCRVIPWARRASPRQCADPAVSFMKNTWVEIQGPNKRTCFGQVQDAGPGQYNDSAYVFGGARPRNRLFNGAGMDVSPALNGCLGFAELNGQNDLVSWRFVSRANVPEGPWTRLITSVGVDQ